MLVCTKRLLRFMSAALLPLEKKKNAACVNPNKSMKPRVWMASVSCRSIRACCQAPSYAIRAMLRTNKMLWNATRSSKSYLWHNPFVWSVFTVSTRVVGSLTPQVPFASQEACEIQSFCMWSPWMLYAEKPHKNWFFLLLNAIQWCAQMNEGV